MTLICTITTTTATLKDFQRLFYLNYYCNTDRFSTTLIALFLQLLQHWKIFNDSYLHYYCCNTPRFSTTLICTIATTTATLRDFQRLFYLHYCCYYYCNTQRFSTTFICIIATTSKKTLKDFQRLLFALLLLLHTDRFSTTLFRTSTTTLIDFERLLFALLLHW